MWGTDHLLDFLKVYGPAATERQPIAVRGKARPVATNGNGNGNYAGDDVEMVMRAVEDAGPLALFVFKTMTDPFTGRVTFFKVLSGKMKADATLTNFTRQETETLTHLYVMQGRKPVEVQELHAGDLGAAVKMRATLTGDMLGDKANEVYLDPVSMPEAAMTYAIEPKTRGDEDKLAPALHKLMEDDPMVKFFRDPQTNEFLVSGAGQQHIEALVSKLSRRYHTNVIVKGPESSVPRDGSRQGGSAGPAQETEWRAWTIWRLQGCGLSHKSEAVVLGLPMRYLAVRFRGSIFRRWRRGCVNRLREDF